jgi:hypothetical protein
LRGGDHLEDIGVDERINLKSKNVAVLTGFNWLG